MTNSIKTWCWIIPEQRVICTQDPKINCFCESNKYILSCAPHKAKGFEGKLWQMEWWRKQGLTEASIIFRLDSLLNGERQNTNDVNKLSPFTRKIPFRLASHCSFDVLWLWICSKCSRKSQLPININKCKRHRPF